MMMRLILAALMLALLPTTAAAQTGEEKFRREMIPRLSAAMPGATLTTKPDEPLSVFAKGGPWEEEVQINLHRIYGYCLNATAEDCESEKATFLSAITKKPESATPASLRLVVRDQAHVDSMRGIVARNGKDPKTDGPLIEPLGGGLYAILVADSPDMLQILPSGELEDMKLTPAQAWALAKRQTQPLLPPMPLASQLKGGAVLLEDHEFGGSILIDLPAWATLAKEVGPNLFVTVVSDRIVFVAVMPDGPNFESFKQTVEEDCRAQARCISPYIYRFRDGRWAIAR